MHPSRHADKLALTQRPPVRPRRLSASGDTHSVALAYSRQKWAVSEAEELPAEIERIVLLGDPCHYRAHLSEGAFAGHYEFCALADGFFVHIANITLQGPYPVSVSAPDMLRIRIASDDNTEYAPMQGARLDLSGASASIIIEPAGQPPAEAVFTEHCRAATVFIHRRMLRRTFAKREHELPEAVRAFVAGTLDTTVTQRLPLGAALLRCLEDLHSCTLEGHSRRLLISAKALEILCHAFKALGEEEGAGAQDVSALTARGVLKAQQRLMKDFAAPPSLDDLAQEVGLSRSSLCAGFRQIVGQTVFDYVADLRMERALTMLGRNDASITQIAYDVGYSHTSSFSLAVQRRFGKTPSELRRNAASGKG